MAHFERKRGYSPLDPKTADRLREKWIEYKEKRGGLAGDIYISLGLNGENLSSEEKQKLVESIRKDE